MQERRSRSKFVTNTYDAAAVTETHSAAWISCVCPGVDLWRATTLLQRPLGKKLCKFCFGCMGEWSLSCAHQLLFFCPSNFSTFQVGISPDLSEDSWSQVSKRNVTSKRKVIKMQFVRGFFWKVAFRLVSRHDFTSRQESQSTKKNWRWKMQKQKTY